MVINWAVTRAKFQRYVIEEQEKEFRKEHEQRKKERESYVLGEGTATVKKFDKDDEGPSVAERPKNTPIESTPKIKVVPKKKQNSKDLMGKVNVRQKQTAKKK